MRGIPRFTADDIYKAYEEWTCNCGPGALAAICEKTLDDVHRAIPNFDERHYTSPSMMFAALKTLNVRHFATSIPKCDWPEYGLVRIQWEGRWTEPGVPIRARYRYTHWVGAQTSKRNGVGIFDINCMNNGNGWVSVSEWAGVIVPYLTKQYPKASGKWHITHSIEVRP